MKKIENLNYENGITLIALVVTIIVLLILAAVSLNLIAGENGIISRSGNAIDEMEKASAFEEIQLELANLLIKYHKEIDDTDGKTLRQYIKENATGITSNGYTYTIGEIDSDKNYKLIINDKNGNKISVAKLTSDGEVIFKESDSVIATESEDDIEPEEKEEIILPAEFTSINYGDKVTNYIANGESDWRIFYKDSSGNIFLILSDYLKVSKIPDGIGMMKNGNYKTAWNDNFTITNLNNADSRFMFSKMTGNGSSIVRTKNYNYKATASLLDTTKWAEFANDTNGFGEKAIGSPTIEMWMKSWNEKNNDTLACDTNENGYRVGTSESNLNVWISDYSMKMKDNYNEIPESDDMYYPHKSEVNENNGNCLGYWFASPSGNGDNSMIRLYYGGDINNYSYNYEAYALRPVVCIGSNVTLKPSIVDKKIQWTIEK